MKKLNWKYVKLARWLVKHIDHDFYKGITSLLESILLVFGGITFATFLYNLIVTSVNDPMDILWMIAGIFMITLAIWEIRFYSYISIEWVNNKFNGDMNDELTKRLWKQI
jgi:hypothetical protein